MNFDSAVPRALNSWQLALHHLGKTLHFLLRALLLSLALLGLGFAWLCCWLDRFRSTKDSTWLIPGKVGALQRVERVPEAAGIPLPARRCEPRTIDSLIRNKGFHA